MFYMRTCAWLAEKSRVIAVVDDEEEEDDEESANGAMFWIDVHERCHVLTARDGQLLAFCLKQFMDGLVACSGVC
eukprot:1813687-Amphidinium_carterae.1